MHQQGWQPKQMRSDGIIKTRGLLNNPQIKKLYNYFGDDNMVYLLTNILKNGGKLRRTNSNNRVYS